MKSSRATREKKIKMYPDWERIRNYLSSPALSEAKRMSEATRMSVNSEIHPATEKDCLMFVLKQHCRFRAITSGTCLNDQLKAVYNHRRKLDVMRFVDPFSWFVCQRWLEFTCLGLSVYLLWYSFSVLAALEMYGISEYQSFKLEALAAQDQPIRDNVEPTSQLLRLLLRGCEVWSDNITLAAFNSSTNSASICFPRSVKVDGFSLTLNSKWNQSIPARFVLRGSNDNGSSWSLVASSSFRLVSEGPRFLDSMNIWPIEKELRFEITPIWPLVVGSPVSCIVLALCALGTAALGFSNRPSAAKRWFVFSCGVLAVLCMTSFAGYSELGMLNDAFLQGLFSLAYAIIGLMLLIAEVFFADALAAVGMLSVAGQIIQAAALYPDRDYLVHAPPYSEIFITMMGGAFVLLRSSFLYRVMQEMRADQAVRDEEWHRIMQLPNSNEYIAKLERFSVRLAAACTSPARQLNRVKSAQRCIKAAKTLEGNVEELCPVNGLGSSVEDLQDLGDLEDGGSPVQCLDQLYSQAFGVVSSLYGLCRVWAAESNGVLENDVEPGNGDHYEENRFNWNSMKQWIDLGFIKKPERSITKVLTCYQSDVSRLLDVCRGRILFDELCDLLTCLQTIDSCDRVRIIRIKNSLLPLTRHDSAGYRGICINFCVNTTETQLLGVDNHVCELQLVIKPRTYEQDSLQNRLMHARYLKLREMRLHMKRRVQFNFWSFRRVTPDLVSNESDNASQIEANETCRTIFKFSGQNEGDGSSGRDGASAIDPVEMGRIAAAGPTFYSVFIRSTLRPGGFLNSHQLSVKSAFHDTSSGSAWFSRTPLAVASSKRIFQAFWFILFLYGLYKCLMASAAISGDGIFKASHVCFTVLGLRSPELPLSIKGVQSFGVLLDGCPYYPTSSNSSLLNNTICVHFEQDIDANGYFFETSSEEIGSDPVLWTVQATSRDGRTFTIGASVVRTYGDASAAFYPELPFPTPESRTTQVKFDLRPFWAWVLYWAVTEMVSGLLALGCFMVSILGRVTAVRQLNIALYTLYAIFTAIAAIGYHTQHDTRAAATCWVDIVSSIVAVVGLKFYEARLAWILVLGSASLLIAVTLVSTVVYYSGWAVAVQSLFDSYGMVLLLFAGVIAAARRRVLNRARALMVPDMLRYDEKWRTIIQTTAASEELATIQNEVQQLARKVKHGIPRQYNRQVVVVNQELNRKNHGQSSTLGSEPSQSVWNDLRRRSSLTSTIVSTEKLLPTAILDCNVWIPGTINVKNPITTLDQLYVQANFLYPILIGKVKTWALVSNGCFATSDSTTYTSFAAVRDEATVHVKWCKLKSVARSVEKIFRSYDQDTSLLVDVCRQCIVFEDLTGLADCLRAIQQDPHTDIVRVKNRLDPAFDSGLSLGYRDIAINMRVVNPETIELGVENHVCEVQLLLKPMAELKKAEGHTNYVAYRNLRGE